jgi:Flp pilus assembly protein TadD
MSFHRLFFALAVLVLPATAAQPAPFTLQTERLQAAIAQLGQTDRETVTEALEMIRRGEDSLALARLNPLTKRNPANSSLRIISAYAMLQLGNLLGAFEEARRAEETGGADAYKCWFLAKVSFLAGKDAVCRRELKHLKGGGELAPEVEQLTAELAARAKEQKQKR